MAGDEDETTDAEFEEGETGWVVSEVPYSC